MVVAHMNRAIGQGNVLLTPEEFTREVMKSMNKAEDAAGLPRGSIVEAWVEQWNNRLIDTEVKNEPE